MKTVDDKLVLEIRAEYHEAKVIRAALQTRISQLSEHIRQINLDADTTPEKRRERLFSANQYLARLNATLAVVEDAINVATDRYTRESFEGPSNHKH